ncbi:MAG TPA: 50S ribosomal protein L10 [Candidatus Dormibacteraeota bacterium]
MPTPQKEQQVALLTDKLTRAKVAVLTDYRGLTVSQLEDLRARLRGGDVEFRVIKNTLARRAAVAAGHDDFQQSLAGPVAIAFGYDDLAVPIRLLQDFTRQTRLRLDIVGGLVEGRVMNPDQVRQLADLPSREVLIAQLMGTVQSPIATLATALQSPLSQLAGALESYRNQLEAA